MTPTDGAAPGHEPEAGETGLNQSQSTPRGDGCQADIDDVQMALSRVTQQGPADVRYIADIQSRLEEWRAAR